MQFGDVETPSTAQPDRTAALSLAVGEPSLDRPRATTLAEYRVIRRNGAVVVFEPAKIVVAMTKAFLAVRGGQGAASAAIREQVERLTGAVVSALVRRQPAGGTFHIEDIQDQVELSLMRDGAHDVARAYVLYRERRSQERARSAPAQPPPETIRISVDGRSVPLDEGRLRATLQAACEGLAEFVSVETVMKATVKNLYDGVSLDEVHKSAILAARSLIEADPAYSEVSARLLLHALRKEVFGTEVPQAAMAQRYAEYLPRGIRLGVEAGLLDERLLQFDLDRLALALRPARDLQFSYLGL
ncbi:MAG TPA: ATP cone domain-containing protein, partial [Burkholderiaceae bacterium]|nr:ATP cone domain-containing protein [Burkholderiaceae bacterium]